GGGIGRKGAVIDGDGAVAGLRVIALLRRGLAGRKRQQEGSRDGDSGSCCPLAHVRLPTLDLCVLRLWARTITDPILSPQPALFEKGLGAVSAQRWPISA